jgi:hypothetical protein
VTSGGSAYRDSQGNLTVPETRSAAYGDIDSFKDKVVVYQLFNIPDADAVVERIQQVQ